MTTRCLTSSDGNIPRNTAFKTTAAVRLMSQYFLMSVVDTCCVTCFETSPKLAALCTTQACSKSAATTPNSLLGNDFSQVLAQWILVRGTEIYWNGTYTDRRAVRLDRRLGLIESFRISRHQHQYGPGGKPSCKPYRHCPTQPLAGAGDEAERPRLENTFTVHDDSRDTVDGSGSINSLSINRRQRCGHVYRTDRRRMIIGQTAQRRMIFRAILQRHGGIVGDPRGRTCMVPARAQL